MKLYTIEGEASTPSTQLVRLTAKLMRVEGLQIVSVDQNDEKQIKKSLTGRFPVLEDAENDGLLISEGLSIARYIARDNALFSSGADLQQRTQIDAWVDHIQSTVVPAANRVFNQVQGRMASDQKTFSISLNDLKQTLTKLDAHLALRNFLVGYQMTLADALLISVLASCFEQVLDKKTRDNQLKNLSRYASILLRMAPCARIFGQINFCKDGAQPNYDAPKPKKEQAAAANNAQKGGDQKDKQQKQNQKQQKKEGGKKQAEGKPESAAAASTETTTPAAEEEKKQ